MSGALDKVAGWIALPRPPRGLDPAATLRAMGRIYVREMVLASTVLVAAGPLMLAARRLPFGWAAAAYLLAVVAGVAALVRGIAVLEGYWRVAGQWGSIRRAHGLARSAPGRWAALLPAVSWIVIQVIDSGAPTQHGYVATFLPWGPVLLAQGTATAIAVIWVLVVSRVPWPPPGHDGAPSGAARSRQVITERDVLSDRALLFVMCSAGAALAFVIGVPVMVVTEGERGLLGPEIGVVVGVLALFSGAVAGDEAHRLRRSLSGAWRRGAALVSTAGALAIVGDGGAALMAIVWLFGFVGAETGTPAVFSASWIAVAVLGLLVAPVIGALGLRGLRSQGGGVEHAAVDSDTFGTPA